MNEKYSVDLIRLILQQKALIELKKIQNLLNPHGIDLSSGVEESKGIKSNTKINNLFKKFYDN